MREIILPILLIFGLLLLIYLFRPLAVWVYNPRNPSKDSNIKSTAETHKWANANDFSFVGYYNIQEGLARLFVAVWQAEKIPCHLVFWRMIKQEQGGCLDFDTTFKNGYAMTTINLYCANILPNPPKTFKQNFPDTNIDDLYVKHLDAIEFMLQEGGLIIQDPLPDFATSTIKQLKQERRFAWQHWYYGLLVFYFMLFRQRRFKGKTIQQQHAERLFTLSAQAESTMNV